MNTIWLSLILSLVAAILCLSSKNRSTTQRIGLAFMSGLEILAIGCLCALRVVPCFLPDRTVDYGPTRLAAMHSSDGSMTDAFILGNGAISSETNYHFYIRSNDGSISPRIVPADSRVQITEDPDLKGEAFWTTSQQEKDFSSSLGQWALPQYDWNRIVSQEFRVPVGTVVTKFTLE